MAFIRANVSVSLDELNRSIERVAKQTGKSLDSVITEAGRMFARSSGKAMPPSGKWGHPARARKREIFEKHVGTYFNEEHGKPEDIEGKRRKNQDMMYGLVFKQGKKKIQKHYWQKSLANKKRNILTRGVAKAQFWNVLALQGVSKPRSAFVGVKAESAARANSGIKRGRGFLLPFVDISSSIRTAEGYRPYAMVRGLNDAKRSVRAWARRLEQEQKKAWR
mgnify:FL=1